MSEALTVEIPRGEAKPIFTFRFPRNGTKDRVNAWKREYHNWWDGYYSDEAENDWLTNPLLAESALLHHDYSHKTIEAAVNSPRIEVSRMAVRLQKLNVEDLAVALAHPRISVFDLFDAEDADPEGERKYRDDQIRLGMTVDETADALVTAREIVRLRQAFAVE